MFIARFNQVNADSKSFKENKKGLLPFIGTVVAGIATATIIDGSIFRSEGFTTGQLYLCDNGVREYEGAELATVIVLGTLTTMEAIHAKKELEMGTGRVLVSKKIVIFKDEKPTASAEETARIALETANAAAEAARIAAELEHAGETPMGA